jgi:hypothetical protein
VCKTGVCNLPWFGRLPCTPKTEHPLMRAGVVCGLRGIRGIRGIHAPAVSGWRSKDDQQQRVCAILGTQWGDEGKGKLSDVLAERCVRVWMCVMDVRDGCANRFDELTIGYGVFLVTVVKGMTSLVGSTGVRMLATPWLSTVSETFGDVWCCVWWRMRFV